MQENDLFSRLKPTTVYLFDNFKKQDMVLCREEDKKECYETDVFLFIKYFFDRKNKSFKQRYEDMISDFEEKISQEAPYVDLDNFHKNLESLTVSGYNFFFYNYMSGKRVKGSYSLINNEIFIDKKGTLRVFGHELLHVASSVIDGDEYKSGFHYANIKERIHLGKYFNEGYTEVLADRYLGLRTNPAYAKDKVFAALIEDVVGKQTMERLYFKADIKGLFSELLKYTSEDKLVQFFKDVESNHKLKLDKNGNITNEQLACFGRCQSFCLECYLEKEKQKGLSDKEIGDNYLSYLDSVYLKTVSGYPNSLYLEVLNRVAKISYSNVMGVKKSSQRL